MGSGSLTNTKLIDNDKTAGISLLVFITCVLVILLSSVDFASAVQYNLTRRLVGDNNIQYEDIVSSSDGNTLFVSFISSNNQPVVAKMSTNGGVTWSNKNGASGMGARSIAVSDDGTKIVAEVLRYGGCLYIMVSGDSGVTWAQKSLTQYSHLLTIASSSDGSRFIIGDYGSNNGWGTQTAGYLYTSSNSGASWVQRSNAGYRYWRDVASSSDGLRLVAVADGGIPGFGSEYIYTSSDGGTTWTARTGSGARAWSSISSSSDGKNLVATVQDGYIYTSTDYGVSWTQRTSAGSRSWNVVVSSANGSIIVASAAGGGMIGIFGGGYLYASEDGGATWTAQTSLGSRGWFRLAMSADGSKLSAVVLDMSSGEYAVYSGSVKFTCGNGIAELGESCDAGVNNGPCPSSCSNTCSLNSCLPPVNCVGSWGACVNGNQTYTITTLAQNGGVACPYANGSKQSCQVCGNSAKEGAEQCDFGASNTNTACVPSYGTNCSYCNLSCMNISVTGAYCGDGSKSGAEQCDLGTLNNNTPCTANYGTNCSYCTRSCMNISVIGQFCGDNLRNSTYEQCDNGTMNNGACPKLCSGVCGLNGCSEICGNLLDDDFNGLVDDGCPVHLTGYLLDGETGVVLSSPGWLMINGSRFDVVAGSMFDVLLPPGAYVLTAGATGYGVNESSVGVSANPTRFNISLPVLQCQADCSYAGRCDFDRCSSVCGVTDPVIIAACQGKLVGHLADLQNGSFVQCCRTVVSDSSVRTGFSMSTCSSQVIPMKRIVSLNGRMYTLVVASFNTCE